jgi:hypothetical protein
MYDYVMTRTKFLKWSSTSKYHRHDCIIQCKTHRNPTLRQHLAGLIVELPACSMHNILERQRNGAVRKKH